MSSLSEQIEVYLKALLDEERSGVLEIGRNFLSEYFHCVPSQINYVLSTRFTPIQGYLVETRRGGGGFLRIVSLQLDGGDNWRDLLVDDVGERISEHNSEGLMNYLYEQGLLTKREVVLLNSIFKDRVLAKTHKEAKDDLRANMLQHVLATLSREKL